MRRAGAKKSVRSGARPKRRHVHPGFRILEHPADLGIEGSGSTLAKAYEGCALGLVSIFVDPSSVRTLAERRITLTALDPDQLLVKWLEEVLYLYDGDGFIVRKPTITNLTDTHLEASLRGESFDARRHRSRLDVKAITYHQLLLAKKAKTFTARVYVDI